MFPYPAGRWLTGYRSVLLAFILGATSPALAAPSGSKERGAAIYERCQACHALGRNRTGPKHCGLFGRRAGSLPDFAYSPAMRGWGVIWTRASLERFIEAPLETLPGTLMGYDGVKSAQERADLIEYLWQAGQDPALCPEESQ